MPIAYKVTDKDRQSYPGRVKSLLYPKGATVDGGELGIFLFRTKKAALAYVEDSFGTLLVLRTRTIGRGKKLPYCPAIAFHFSLSRLKIFMSNLNQITKLPYQPEDTNGTMVRLYDTNLWVCPPETMVYPSVEVLT